MILNSERMAKEAFERIRDQPYRVPEFSGDFSCNCFTKSLQLIEALSTLGFTVRGRLADMDWRSTPFPAELTSLWPEGILTTHFFVEVKIENEWRALDASWDAALSSAGFSIAEWSGLNSPAFPLLKVYELEEQARCFALFQESEFAAEHFLKQESFKSCKHLVKQSSSTGTAYKRRM